MKTIKALLLLLSGVSLVAQAQTSQQSWQIEPGVVLDEGRDQVYVMRPQGGIEALALTSGATVWRVSQADLPTGVIQDGLLARADSDQTGELPLALLNPDNGEVLQEYSVPLPEQAAASVDNGLGREFNLLLSGDNIDWSYRFEEIKGRPELAPSAPVRSGSNFQSAPHREISTVVKLFGRLQLESDLSAIRIIGESNQQSFSPRPEDLAVNVLSGQTGRQFRSVSGRYVLVSQRSDDETDVLYDWRVFRRDGSFIGQATMPYSFLPFEVADGHLLVVEPPMIRAVNGQRVASQSTLTAINLTRGRVAWQHPIRDIQYRGPYPR